MKILSGCTRAQAYSNAGLYFRMAVFRVIAKIMLPWRYKRLIGVLRNAFDIVLIVYVSKIEFGGSFELSKRGDFNLYPKLTF